jgi:hypothetical protein
VFSLLNPRIQRILDFDIENRPLGYLGEGFTTAEVTAIAACFHGEPSTMRVWLLGRDEPKDMFEGFLEMYDEADMVTGHYIRNHDLPIINAGLIELGIPCLGEKLTQCTKNDLVKRKDLSASQENLSAMFNLPLGKAHMSNNDWRKANRLTPEGLKLTDARARGDVKQHIALYRILVERNLLKAPKVWRP